MIFRTDLALERKEDLPGNVPGISTRESKRGRAKITRLRVEDERGEQAIEKPVGNYVTIELPAFTDNINDGREELGAVAEELTALLPAEGLVLVIGLGNEEITPDALGPWSARRILATRHINGEIARSSGLDLLRKVAVLSTGVLGQTGIETVELLSGLTQQLKPAAVIAIDALASRKLTRLGCTIQMSDSGISPGAGVGNKRPCLNQETVGVPVVSIGVPTVVDAATLAAELVSPHNEEEARVIREMVAPRGAQMVVTPREVDLLVRRAAASISLAVNCALHPDISPEDFQLLVS